MAQYLLMCCQPEVDPAGQESADGEATIAMQLE